MQLDVTELTLKHIIGEQLTEDEETFLKNRSIKYELVRFLYIEKMKHLGVGLEQFHFSPGTSFEDTPIIDVVNSLLEISEKTSNGEYEPLVFGDQKWKSNPPILAWIKLI